MQSGRACVESDILARLSATSSKVGITEAAHASSSQVFCPPLQQISKSMWTTSTTLVISRDCQHHHKQACSSHSKAAGKDMPVLESHSSSNHRYDLLQLGFTSHQADRVIAYLLSQKFSVNIKNVSMWLQLLCTLQVQESREVVFRHPVILKSRASNLTENADALLFWLSGIGLTSSKSVQLLGESPVLLCIPQATAAAVGTWFNHELRWSNSMVVTLLFKFPQLFSQSAVGNLSPKLDWFLAQGFSREKLASVFYNSPTLLSHSIQRNNTQRSALQALGLTESEVSAMIRKAPALLGLSIDSPNTQAKIRFVTHAMGRQLGEIWACPRILTYSLSERLGPRWSFYSLYCQQGQPFSSGLQIQADRRTLC